MQLGMIRHSRETRTTETGMFGSKIRENKKVLSGCMTVHLTRNKGGDTTDPSREQLLRVGNTLPKSYHNLQWRYHCIRESYQVGLVSYILRHYETNLISLGRHAAAQLVGRGFFQTDGVISSFRQQQLLKSVMHQRSFLSMLHIFAYDEEQI